MKRLILALFFFVLGTCASHVTAQTGLTPAPIRVHGSIDETELVTLKGNIHPLARTQFDRGAAPGSMPTGRIRLVLQRSPEQQQELTQYLSDLENSASPAYHKWLTPEQFGTAFGVSQSDLLQVQSWLQAHGLAIEKIPAAHNVIEFSGTFDQVQSAFHTSIHTFMVNGEAHFANVSDPQIPAALAPVIAGVGPLNDFHAKPMLVRGPNGRFDPSTGRIVPELTLESNNTLYLFVDPADAAIIYDTPNSLLNPAYSGTTYDGTGVAIGIAGVSDLTTADVANYRMAFLGEASGSVNLPTVVVDGNDPGLNGAGIEALLDTEVSGGIAPKAKIYFYTSADTDLSSGLLNAIFRALGDNTVSILSISFGSCEAALGTSGNQVILEAAEQAAAEGITLTVSAGDNGSAGCDDFDTEEQATKGFAVNGFASTPYTIAVGGTDFDTLSNSFATYVKSNTSGAPPYYGTALQYIPENPWNDSTQNNTTYSNNVAQKNGDGNIVAGSGGVSSVYAKPAFQSSLTPNDGFRDLPDVSLLAGNGLYRAAWVICSDNVTDGVTSENYTECLTTGGQFTGNTYFGGVGGTSASAPAFAGMLALVAQAHGSASDNYRLGQADNVLYQLAQSKYSTVFHDITTGNNSVACTSGSPDCGSNLFLTGYNAGTGYDLASGLGSVNAAAMVANWTSVPLASTSTSLKINGATSAYSGVHGQSLTFAVGVTPTTASGVAGIVDNADMTAGGTASGPQNNGQIAVPLTSGSGSISYNGLPGGSYTVWARYGGDTANASSTSTPPIPVSISAEPSTTTLQVNAYNPSTGAPLGLVNVPYGSEIIADAQIEGTAEGSKTQGLATGTVTFSSGISNNILTLGTAVVASGNIASLPLFPTKSVPLSAGSQTVTASYSGDASYASSNGAGVTVTVTKASTTTAITGYPATVTVPGLFYLDVSTTFLALAPFGQAGNSTAYTVSVNGTSLGPFPEGGDGGYTGPDGTGNPVFLTSVAVDAQYLQQGQNVLNVTYTGDTNYTPSTSANVNINYTVGVGSFTLTNAGNISIIVGSDGQTSLTLTPSGGFLGQVNFACSVSGAPAGVTCNAGLITITSAAAASTTLFVITNSSAPAGSYTVLVTASDYATGNITASTTVTLTVASAPPLGLSLSNSGNISVAPGATAGNTSTISVTPSGGFTGAVNLTCAVTTSMTSVNDMPGCSLSPAAPNVTGTAAVTSTLKVSTTAATSGALVPGPGYLRLGGLTTVLAVLFFFGIPSKRRKWMRVAGAIVLAASIGALGCGGGGGTGTGGGGGGGGGGNPGTTPGAYSVTVTGTDAATGKFTAQTTVALSVN